VLYTPLALPAEFWLWMALCTLLTVSGNVLIVAALKRADLSVLGPINSYKSVVSLVPSAILLGEIPGGMGLGGIALILAGSYFIAGQQAGDPKRNSFVRFFSDRGVQYRFAALILSALEAVVIKKALLASSVPASFAFWAIFGFGVSSALVLLTIRGPKLAAEFSIFRHNAAKYGMLVVSTGLMQLCTLVVLDGFQVGPALALFQVSTIVSVLLGWQVFREPHILKRLFGSLIMTAGAVLIIIGRK
jgi:drug/metabolite transporter (DMT)-like permease